MMRYKASLFQDGIEVAGVDAPSEQECIREIQHYAMVYGQDGPVNIKYSFVPPAAGEPSDQQATGAARKPK